MQGPSLVTGDKAVIHSEILADESGGGTADHWLAPIGWLNLRG
jgi:hypothetical protein